MLYAQNGATDAELRHDEHGNLNCRLRKKRSTLGFPDLDLDRRHGSRSSSPEFLRGGAGVEVGEAGEEVLGPDLTGSGRS